MIGEWRSKEYIEQNIDEDLRIATKIGYLSIEGDTIIIKNENKNSFKQITFMAQLTQSFIDSYYIVLHAINVLMERGSVVQKKYILNDLYHCVQETYFQGAT